MISHTSQKSTLARWCLFVGFLSSSEAWGTQLCVGVAPVGAARGWGASRLHRYNHGSSPVRILSSRLKRGLASPVRKNAWTLSAKDDFSSIEAWEREFKALPKTASAPAAGFDSLFQGVGSLFLGKQKSQDDDPLSAQAAAAAEVPAQDGFRVVTEFPHVKESFTQGICWVEDEQLLYEGSGGPEFSHGTRISKVDLATGNVLLYRQLPPRYFGEGVTVLGDRVYQLTWTSRIGFIYDRHTLRLVGTFPYSHEGWGATTDGTSLIISDGSAALRYYDPATFAVTRTVTVRQRGRKTNAVTPVQRLNDLQWVDGRIYANIWESDRIAIIDPSTGVVERYLELAGLLDDSDEWVRQFKKSDRCLNGVAYDAARRRLLVTGKMWTRIYEVEALAGQAAGAAETEGVGSRPADYYSAAGAFDPLGMGIK